MKSLKLHQDIHGRWLIEESRVGEKFMLSLNIPNFPDDVIPFGGMVFTVTRIDYNYPYRIFGTINNEEGCLHYSWCRWNVSVGNDSDMFVVTKILRLRDLGKKKVADLIRRIK